MNGDIQKGDSVSSYQAPNDVADFVSDVRKDYAIGEEILNRTYVELNDRSIVEDENRGQMMFNAFVDTSVEDAAEAWKWRGTRSMARNKGITMHANLTANYLLPLFMAQNDDDETDVDFSETMRDIIEWMASPSNSNYQSSFLQVVFGALTNPVTYLGAEYCEVYQTIKEKKANGKYTSKEIVDEVLSGFNAPIWSSTQVLITNAYERNIQRQRKIIKRRFVEKSELEAKYGDYENFAYVQPGWKTVYNYDDNLFYDVKDRDRMSPTIVVEETVLNRRDDSQVCFINGIPMIEGKIEDSPISHRDNRGAPKYNITPFGYSRIGEHFFYYKSMMNSLGWDNMLYDAQNEVFMNRALLEAEMPVAISGSDKIDSEIIFPNSVVTLEDPNAKVNNLLPNGNLNALSNAILMTEKSINDGSVNQTVSGQIPTGSPTAYSVAQAQNNAKKMIGAVAKSIAESIIQYGDLMKDIAINHVTAPQIDEIVGGGMKLKYRSFLIDSKSGTNDTSEKSIKFDSSLIGKSMTPSEKMYKEVDLAVQAGYPNKSRSIRLVNPELFAKYKYLTKVDVEEMFPKNQDYWQPVLTQLYTLVAQNPYINQQEILKKLMRSYFQSAGNELVKDNIEPTQQSSVNAPETQYGQMVQNKELSNRAQFVTA